MKAQVEGDIPSWLFEKGENMEKLPQNIFYKKSTGAYVYQKRFNGKRREWSRKNLEDILEVKKTVEEYHAEHGKLPEILDPQADVDYQKELPIGKTVGEWLILGYVIKGKRVYAECKCSCGKIKQVYAPSLLKGISMSCGHTWIEKLREEDFQRHAKNNQRKRTEPNIDNKLNERYISYDEKRKRYTFSIVRFGVKVRRYYYDFDEAIEFKKEVLDAIEKNGGKIPLKYI